LLPATLSAEAVTPSSDGRLMGEAAEQKTPRCRGAEEGGMPHASQSGMSPLSLR